MRPSAGRTRRTRRDAVAGPAANAATSAATAPGPGSSFAYLPYGDTRASPAAGGPRSSVVGAFGHFSGAVDSGRGPHTHSAASVALPAVAGVAGSTVCPSEQQGSGDASMLLPRVSASALTT